MFFFQRSYLPSMPQDRLTDIWKVLKESALASKDSYKECIIYCKYFSFNFTI